MLRHLREAFFNRNTSGLKHFVNVDGNAELCSWKAREDRIRNLLAFVRALVGRTVTKPLACFLATLALAEFTMLTNHFDF